MALVHFAWLALLLVALCFSGASYLRGQKLGRRLSALTAMTGFWIGASSLALAMAGITQHNLIGSRVVGISFVLGFALAAYPTVALVLDSYLTPQRLPSKVASPPTGR